MADRYLLQAPLGEGTAGVLYAARHVTLHTRVVVKLLHEPLCRDELAVERFRREAVMVSEVENEHIVRVLDFGRHSDGRFFLVREMLEGETLAQRLRRGPLPILQAVDILRQLGEALMEVHALGTLHRDLRPGNLFLTERRGGDFVKIFDFGLAKLVDQDGVAASTQLGMTLGDPRYMAPEQGRGGVLDRRCDLYSMGIIAFEMLTGEPPFQGPPMQVLADHQTRLAPAPSTRREGVPVWLDEVIGTCLAKAPDDRYLTVYRMLESLVAQGAERNTVQKSVAETPASAARSGVPPDEQNPSASRSAQRVAESHPSAGKSASAPPVLDLAGVPQPLGHHTLSGKWFDEGEAIDAESRAEALRIADEGNPWGIQAEERPRRKGRTSVWAGVLLVAVAGGAFGAVLGWGNNEAPAPVSAGPGALPASPGASPASPGASPASRGASPASPGASPASPGASPASPGASPAFPGASPASPGASPPTSPGGPSGLSAPAVQLPQGAPPPATAASAADVRPLVAAAALPAPDRADSPPSPREATAPGSGASERASSGDEGASTQGAAGQARDTLPAVPGATASPAASKPVSATPGTAGNSSDVARTRERGLGRGGPPIVTESRVETEDTRAAVDLVDKGQNRLAQGDSEGALEFFLKARARDHLNAYAVAGLGQVALSRGHSAEAVIHLRAAVRLAPGSASLWILLGNAYQREGHPPHARRAYERALELDPSNEAARQGMKALDSP